MLLVKVHNKTLFFLPRDLKYPGLIRELPFVFRVTCPNLVVDYSGDVGKNKKRVR